MSQHHHSQEESINNNFGWWKVQFDILKKNLTCVDERLQCNVIDHRLSFFVTKSKVNVIITTCYKP